VKTLLTTCLIAALLAIAPRVHADDGPTTSPAEPPAADEPKETMEPPPAAAAPTPAVHPSRPHARMQQASARRESLKDDSRLDKKEDKVLGGRHWRIKTPAGALHVWTPPGYNRATAGTVIYVHGYYTDVDVAWKEHNLARQFKASRQNALFIVPEAPVGNDDNVKWTALTELRKAVARANIHLPDGPVVVLGHSGAFRTVMQWVDHKLIDQVILLDALYGGESAFDQFIDSGKRADEHKLIVVGAATASESRAFVKQYPFAIAREKVPGGLGGFSKRERRAKLLYIRSQFEHMAIVTSGKVIPLLLHLTPLKSL
jgi:hypothetical protein